MRYTRMLDHLFWKRKFNVLLNNAHTKHSNTQTCQYSAESRKQRPINETAVEHKISHHKSDNSKKLISVLLSVGGVFCAILLLKNDKSLEILPKISDFLMFTALSSSQENRDNKTSAKMWHLTHRTDLPTYLMKDVECHNCVANRVWITYGIGVYDITDFIPKHPGSDNIMIGAGSAIDPFWEIYQQHNNVEILTLLEKYRIGNLELTDRIDSDNMESFWSNEPQRHAALQPSSEKPFNAEPPTFLLVDDFITPNEFFYIRNHLPVPNIDIKTYELNIEVETSKSGTNKKVQCFTFDDIKKLPKHTVTATIMCGGNRRSEMASVKPVKGLSWGPGAVGNAKWSGARLRDILIYMGVRPNENLHIIFEGADFDPTSKPYGASIPLSKAMDERGDVILAYEMNGQLLGRDHGYPIRVVVPGTIGARNVKWLSRICVSEQESDSHWQQNDYKGFSPSTDWDSVDFSKSPAIQSMPVTSAICTPYSGEKVSASVDGYITVRGYAWSGGGRKIIRVDVSSDQGKTWHVAELEQEDNPDGRHYAWTLWSVRIPVDKNIHKELEIWSKAVDSSYNVQPESFANIWNLRGVLANAYHRIKIILI